MLRPSKVIAEAGARRGTLPGSPPLGWSRLYRRVESAGGAAAPARRRGRPSPRAGPSSGAACTVSPGRGGVAVSPLPGVRPGRSPPCRSTRGWMAAVPPGRSLYPSSAACLARPFRLPPQRPRRTIDAGRLRDPYPGPPGQRLVGVVRRACGRGGRCGRDDADGPHPRPGRAARRAPPPGGAGPRAARRPARPARVLGRSRRWRRRRVERRRRPSWRARVTAASRFCASSLRNRLFTWVFTVPRVTTSPRAIS